MKILSIDTTAVTAACALCDGEILLASYQQNGGLTHSETMLSMVEHMLASAKTAIEDIDLFAVSAGPGSFTGVRIGVSLVKGLAFAAKKPCVPVSTLEALAENLRPLAAVDKPFYACPVMDARRSQLYNALFLCERDASGVVHMTRLTEDRVISSEELQKALADLPHPVIFAGEGCRVTERELCLPHAREAAPALRYQNGYSVAMAALRKYEAAEEGTAFDDLTLAPTYLRPSQAEREKKQKEEA